MIDAVTRYSTGKFLWRHMGGNPARKRRENPHRVIRNYMLNQGRKDDLLCLGLGEGSVMLCKEKERGRKSRFLTKQNFIY